MGTTYKARMPPKSEAKKASKGLSRTAITGVIIKFKVKKLGAPIKTLMGIVLKATYRAAKIPILAALKLSTFKAISPDRLINLHRPFSFGKQL